MTGHRPVEGIFCLSGLGTDQPPARVQRSTPARTPTSAAGASRPVAGFIAAVWIPLPATDFTALPGPGAHCREGLRMGHREGAWVNPIAGLVPTYAGTR
jgi:hypothetical protein